MKELYHYHITVEGVNAEQLKTIAKLVGAKPTSIDLYNDTHSQLDRMITKYGREFLELMKTLRRNAQTIEESGVKVKRMKLERVYSELPSSVVGDYLEVHVKVKDTADLAVIDGFSLSKNPSEQGTKFYNCRIYEDQDISFYKQLIDKINYIEVQYEAVLFDSNKKVDEWWA